VPQIPFVREKNIEDIIIFVEDRYKNTIFKREKFMGQFA
jgi:hypothetical protein